MNLILKNCHKITNNDVKLLLLLPGSLFVHNFSVFRRILETFEQ